MSQYAAVAYSKAAADCLVPTLSLDAPPKRFGLQKLQLLLLPWSLECHLRKSAGDRPHQLDSSSRMLVVAGGRVGCCCSVGKDPGSILESANVSFHP